MNNDQMSTLAAALQRAAATMRGAGGMQPPNFDMTGMFNPAAMASQGQAGLQPTPNAQVANRFGGMQPPSQPTPNAQVANRFGGMAPPSPTPNQYVAQNFPGAPPPPAVAQAPAVPTPQPRPGAPASEPMGFFQRNTAMMRDPVTGMFIDPSAAAQAQSGGIIPKMLGLLHNKANNA